MSDTNHHTAQLAPELIDLLVCPVTRGPLQYDATSHQLISAQAGLAFPIRDGVPVLLEDQATKIDTSSL